EALARGSEGLFNSPLSEEVQHRLIKDNDLRIRLALAKNKRLTPEVQILLAKDIDNSVKRKLIEESDRMNPLSLLVQEQLANDPDVTIRSDLARCLFSGLLAPRSSQKIRLRLANDPNEAVRDIIIKMGLFELTYSSEQYNDAVLDGLLVRATHEQMELINRIREKNRLAIQ
ncbi:TPA: AAA family ATPase, partial [Citrobacter freundii]